MPNHSVESIISSDWWNQFLADKDSTSWKVLSTRYGVAIATLRKALETVGASKKPQPAGRKAAGARVETAASKPARPVTKRRPGAGKVAPKRSAAPAETEAASASTASNEPKTTAAVRLKAWHDRMGKEADGVIAKEAGIDRRHVVDYRKAHGIPAYEGFRATGGASRAAAEPKVTKAPRRAASSKTASAAPASATAPTASPETPKRGRGRPGPRPSKLDAYRDQVGTISDNEIAKLAGVSAEAVRQYRLRHDIPGVSERSAPAASAPKPTARASKGTAKVAAPAVAVAAAVAVPPVEPATPKASPKAAPKAASLQAFAVVAARGHERQRFVVTSATIADAAAQAAQALAARGPEWSVRSIRHLCEALA